MIENKKGFTLIEMLVTVAIIGVLSVVIGISVTNMLARQKEKKFETYKSDLEKAACTFAQNENITDAICTEYPNSCKKTVAQLISDGYVKKDVINPNTGKTVEDDKSSIVIEYKNNERICTYKEG